MPQFPYWTGKRRQHKSTRAAVFAGPVIGAWALFVFSGIGPDRATPGEPPGNWRAAPGLMAGGQTTAEGGSAADRKLFHEVMDRLLQTKMVRDAYPTNFAWPPEVLILPNSAKIFNAFACGYARDTVTGKILCRACITEGYMTKVVDGEGEILAAIMGHELAHITKGHLSNYVQRDLAGLVIGRDQEIEADLEGAKIAVAGGFSFKSGIRSAFREWKVLGDRSSFEGIAGTHPSWVERLKYLDQEQAQIWKAMAAFQNGHFFLLAEQYRTAEACFQAVVEDFPACAEAWSNLGYSRLMQYCDALDEKDLRKMGLAQFVAGCFYARPQGLVPTRATDDKMWKLAVSDLNNALKRDPSLMLARANLGLAYLVHPDGKKVTEALNCFHQAANQKDKGLDGLGLVAFLVNYGVAEQAAGSLDAAALKYKTAIEMLPKTGFNPITSQIDLALLYNEGMLKAESGDAKTKAVGVSYLGQYLKLAGTDSAWWKLAFDEYEKAGTALGSKLATREALAERKAGKVFRIVTSVEPASGKLLTLSDSTVKALGMFGKDKVAGVPVFNRAKVKRYADVSPGVDFVAADTILALFLTSDKAPPVHVQSTGVGNAKIELRVGMPLREFQQLLKDQPEEASTKVVDPAVNYVFFPYLGLAYRNNGSHVTELVIAQIPRKSPF